MYLAYVIWLNNSKAKARFYLNTITTKLKDTMIIFIFLLGLWDVYQHRTYLCQLSPTSLLQVKGGLNSVA